MMLSYLLAHAGASRNSRVGATLCIPSEARAVAALWENAAPRFVLVSPGGDVLVDEGHRVTRFAIGVDEVSTTRASRGILEERWEGACDFVGPREARMLGYRIIDGVAYGIYQHHHGRAARDELIVEMFSIAPPAEGAPSGYTEYFGELGTGALDEDGGAWVVVGGRALRLDPAGDPAAPPQHPDRSDLGRARVVAERELEADNAYDASLTRAGFIVLAVDTCASSSRDRFYADIERLRGASGRWKWTTSVVCLDDGLAERWRATVPFAVRQPPIDGGDDRVVVAGDAVAALEGGAVRWTHTFPFPCSATADAQGAVVAASGSALHYLDAAGTAQRRLEVPEAILTPPALDADGNTWFATATALYRTG